MKQFLSLICLVVMMEYSVGMRKKMVQLPPEATSALVQAVQQCIPQTGVQAEALLKVFQGGYDEDTNFKEFIYCCYKSAGFLKPDGSLNIEKSLRLFKDPDVVEGIQRCGQKTGDTPVERMFNCFKCWQDTVPVAFTL